MQRGGVSCVQAERELSVSRRGVMYAAARWMREGGLLSGVGWKCWEQRVVVWATQGWDETMRCGAVQRGGV